MATSIKNGLLLTRSKSSVTTRATCNNIILAKLGLLRLGLRGGVWDKIHTNKRVACVLEYDELHDIWCIHRSLLLVKHTKIHLLVNEAHDIKRSHWKAIHSIEI